MRKGRAVTKAAETDALKIISELELTEKQAAFVLYYMQGMSKADAAEAAGYAFTSGMAVYRTPKVQAAMARIMERFLIGELAPMAMRSAYRLLDDDATPAGVRASLVLGILDRAGFDAKRHAKRADAPSDVSTMTADELRAEIARLEAEQEARMKDVSGDGEPDDEPDNTQAFEMFE